MTAGRPQSYIGQLEDRVVEARAIGMELAMRHDPHEFVLLRNMGHLLRQIRDVLPFDHPAQPLVARAIGISDELQVIDLGENRKHRVIAGDSVEAAA